jgi:hypothetical protein
MASGSFSPLFLGSPAKPGSAMIMACKSVKRRFMGYVLGCASARRIAMSWTSVDCRGLGMGALREDRGW